MLRLLILANHCRGLLLKLPSIIRFSRERILFKVSHMLAESSPQRRAFVVLNAILFAFLTHDRNKGPQMAMVDAWEAMMFRLAI